MIWTVAEFWEDAEARKHAGGKAREDLSTIFTECGFSVLEMNRSGEEKRNGSLVNKIAGHFRATKEWETLLSTISSGDTLILQFPIINHTLLLSSVIRSTKRRNVKVIAFIHDLESLRMSNDATVSMKMRWRLRKEELDVLKLFDVIVVHNNKMKKMMTDKYSIDEKKIVELGIFDYLIDDSFEPEIDNSLNSCIIAGNLSNIKSAYISKLPIKPDFELYGINYEGSQNDNIHYHGSFLADDLPFQLKGGFGLVWDGDSADTCNGVWGEYLRYNNPHKTSLYLACGIPVIIWEEAALADYVINNNVGIAVKSLYEIDEVIRSLANDEYKTMKENAIKLSSELRHGENTKMALRAVGAIKN